jgi:hypothetical protein
MSSRLLIALTLALAACMPAQSIEAFCDQAVPVLSRDDLGDDPAAMQQQIEDLSTAAELLPDDRSSQLRTQIGALNEELELAVRGQATSGWSNAEIVGTVGAVCGEDDLISWTVQP